MPDRDASPHKIGDQSSAPGLREIADPKLARLLSHPMRLRILGVLERVGKASPKEMAVHLGVPLEGLSYHVRELAKAGVIEEVERLVVRGAVMHRYRLVEQPLVSADAFASLPRPVRDALTASGLGKLALHAAASYLQGRMDRPNGHVVRQAIKVDEEGWNELSALLSEVTTRAADIAARAAGRLKQQGSRTADELGATIGLLLFETPDIEGSELALFAPHHDAPDRKRGELIAGDEFRGRLIDGEPS